MMVNEICDFVNGLADDELYVLVREVRTRLTADGSASRHQGTKDEEERDSLLDYAASTGSADDFSEGSQGLTDVTKQLSETQRVALYKLLKELDPDARCINWDNENPAEFDEIELARLCIVKTWPLDDWNRRDDAESIWIYDEDGNRVRDEHGHDVENPNWKAELDRQAALLEAFRPECADE